MPDVPETRPWTCPKCQETWAILVDELPIPEEASRCPTCAPAPDEFTLGQIVLVLHENSGRRRHGIIDEPVQAGCPHPEEEGLLSDHGPYTGEWMVFHLYHGYGSTAPLDPERELEIFGALPLDPKRRHTLALNFMTGVSARPEHISALGTIDEHLLLDAGA